MSGPLKLQHGFCSHRYCFFIEKYPEVEKAISLCFSFIMEENIYEADFFLYPIDDAQTISHWHHQQQKITLIILSK